MNLKPIVLAVRLACWQMGRELRLKNLYGKYK